MLHNLMFVDYGLGQPGSVHDAYVFQGIQMAMSAGRTILEWNWIWADSAYPSEHWCVTSFKKPRNGNLTCQQNVYNQYLSKVRTSSACGGSI